MKIVVIGGTGLIGSRLVALLQAAGHEALPAAPSTGVDAVTGAGLAPALRGADVVVDVANAPSFAAAAVLAFFQTATANLLAAEADAGVGHHVALSVVGTDRSPDNDYFRAKLAQETLIARGPVPFTIVRATQFFEFIGAIADAGTRDGAVHLPPVLTQPIAAQDVAVALAQAAVAAPVGGVVEVAGPEEIRMDELVRTGLAAAGDERPVVTDPEGRYFGSRTQERALLPGADARLAPTTLAAWLAASEARV
jgi:uncharacterized protein YbjT (DUF2867 family)